jgi:hypothetical protein
MRTTKDIRTRGSNADHVQAAWVSKLLTKTAGLRPSVRVKHEPVSILLPPFHLHSVLTFISPFFHPFLVFPSSFLRPFLFHFLLSYVPLFCFFL